MSINSSLSPQVLLVTDINYLVPHFTQHLEAVGCRVSVLADNLKVNLGTDVEVFTSIQALGGKHFEYVVVIGLFPHMESYQHRTFLKDKSSVTGLQHRFKIAAEYAEKNKSKLLLVVPTYARSVEERDVVQSLQHTAAVTVKKVLVGEVVIPTTDWSTPVLRMLAEAVQNRRIAVANLDTIVTTASLPEIFSTVDRALFSYWSGYESFTVQNVQSLQAFLNVVTQFIPDLQVLVSTSLSEPIYIKEGREVSSSFSAQQVKEVLIYIRDSYQSQPRIAAQPKVVAPTVAHKVQSLPTPKTKIQIPQLFIPKLQVTLWRSQSRISKKAKLATAFCLLAILVTPIIVFGIAGLSLLLGGRQIMAGRAENSQRLFNTSATFASLTKTSANTLSLIPLVGKPYKRLAYEADIVSQISRIGKNASKTYENAQVVMNGLVGNSSFDVKQVSSMLFLELDSLYKDTSFLETEISKSFLLTRFTPAMEEVAYGRKLIVSARDISSRLPLLLGGEQRSTYLVLLQNNMELRPTGGFIGSFALITFEKGKLIDTMVYDVYEADGQLKGYVEPPAPIRDYLGEAKWYLRDSNWDADFPTSASRAEWFLEKELDRKVDGVIAIDLEVAKSILSLLGSVTLPDYNQEITADNLYEKVQYEVEANFFPGSQKKASFLTALTRELLRKLTEGAKSQTQNLARVILDSFESKHIQVALHDESTAATLRNLNWDGAVSVPSCGTGCINLWTGVVEANVGVNKANYYVKRSNALHVALSENFVEYTYSIQLSNSSTQDLRIGGRYKAYLRALAQSGSTFSQVEITGKGIKKISPELTGFADRVEAGVLVEVPPGEERTVIYRWKHPVSLNLQAPGNGRLLVRKQAGTVEDPMTITFQTAGRQLFGKPPFALTNQSFYGYNSVLEKDILTSFSW